jgi:hypothetical protein
MLRARDRSAWVGTPLLNVGRGLCCWQNGLVRQQLALAARFGEGWDGGVLYVAVDVLGAPHLSAALSLHAGAMV